MKNWWLFISLVINLSALLWGLTALKFSFTWVRRKAPPGPPKYEKNIILFHILGLNLQISYQIASLLHMYIDMGERIAGKQDRPSLIIEDPLRAPKIAPPKKTWFSNCFLLLYICLHCDEVCICWHFGAPGTPGFYVSAQHDPEKNEIYFIFLIFLILTQKVLIRLLLSLTCKLLLNRGYMWTLMGPVWLFETFFYLK